GPAPWFSAQELAVYAEYCRQNVLALVMSATPNYYLPGVPDGSVSGVVVTVHTSNAPRTIQSSQISLRPGVALQSTLFSLSQQAAQSLLQLQLQPADWESLRAGVTILYDAALHGTIADCDLGGFDPRNRALLVLDRSKAGLVYDPERSADDLL